jgi:chromosome segregation ATPase
MRESCLSYFRQGWLGLPLFFVGLVSLAFSQFEGGQGQNFESTSDLVDAISANLKEGQEMLEEISTARNQMAVEELNKVTSQVSQLKKNGAAGSPEVAKIESKLSEADNRLEDRLKTIDQRIQISEDRLADCREIFVDLEENFGGRLDEAKPALLVLNENLSGASSELLALAEMLEGINKDFVYELSIINDQINGVALTQVPVPPTYAEAKPVGMKNDPIQRRISSALAIDDNQNPNLSRLRSTIQPTNPKLQMIGRSIEADAEDVEVIEKLRSELESSKTVQTELSKDSAELKSDLRKAYREIVSLEATLKESKLLIDELEKNKQSLYKSDDGSPATVKTVSARIVRLEKELDLARDDLRQSRQSLLLEQKRSSAMIESITAELDRTRRELDQARMAVQNNGGNSARLAFLERELAQARSALEMAQAEPVDPGSQEYVNLQNELRKSLGELARMQIELGEMDGLKDELAQLKSSMEQMDNPRGSSPEFVNKLIVELNAANSKLEKLQSGNAEERGILSTGVNSLEEELFATKKELELVRKEFDQTKEQIAKKEFEFATTIKNLEEEAQRAQVVLQDSAGQPMPAIPYISEMEDNLASSESRIRLLSEQFANEQSRATEVISSLQEELELAQARHKETLNQLSRREFDLKGKNKEVAAIEQQKKALEEELEVVKVIAGQLNDLNEVLEETKETQFMQNSDSDDLVASLREELNRVKVELVVTTDDRDRLREEFADNVDNLNRQLEDTRNEMIEEQELFYTTTTESKNIVNELKSELDNAREEIAKMKASGMSDSIETKEAVAQLQEALGTIRILQESLEEAEQANLEVDNLKSELADAMSSQLENLKGQEDEKLLLVQKIEDLETEIAVLRENKSGSTLQANSQNKQLIDDLKVAQIEIQTLEKQLSLSESGGINSLVVLEEELAELKNENIDLKNELATIGPREAETIARLEDKLSKAVARLNTLRNDEGQDFLLAELQDDNDRLTEELESLTQQLRNTDSPTDTSVADSDKIAQLENQLEKAIEQIDMLSTDDTPITAVEMELTMAQQTIDELSDSLNQRDLENKEMSAKLDQAFAQIDSLRAGAPVPANSNLDQLEEIAGLQMEIDTLRDELNQARSEPFVPSTSQDVDMQEIQDELRNAVAESFELQMELEQTQLQMQEMEKLLAQKPEGSLDDYLANSQQAEQEAQQRIEELSAALRQSEQLRSETEDLLTEMERSAAASGQDISDDPRFLALQQEMIGLQNDLLAAQQMDDPRVLELEGALEASQSESNKLNAEFKSVLADFTSLKDELTALEAENRRIREISIAQAREQSNPAAATMQVEINNLSRENANLAAQIAEKDRRIDGLRDDLAGSPRNPNESEMRSQLIQLQIKNQSLTNAESQAKRESQRLRQDLSVAQENLRSAETRLRDLERNAQSPLNRTSPAQLAELEELRVQNRSLQSQMEAMGNVPNRDRMERQIRDLNQQNTTYQIQLDREKIMVDDLKKQLADARSIKQEVVERGKAANMKIDLLNGELSDSRSRVESLEKALVAARQAIRVLQSGGSESTLIPVSNPSSFSSNAGRTGSGLSSLGNSYLPARRIQLPDELGDRSSSLQFEPNRSSTYPSVRSPASASVQNTARGNSSLQLQAKVQFLDNKNRPAGFTEFFLVEDDLDTIMANEGIQVPTGAGIQSPAEYWARAVQRGYRFPGVAAKIRNALARASLKRIKTNSLGEGNLDNLAAGRYYVVGASTLGQVGVVWSKPVTLNSGDNRINLDLRDAAWAQ